MFKKGRGKPKMATTRRNANLVRAQSKGPAAASDPGRKRGLGVFQPNRRQPIHRWLPFVEGYSYGLVARLLDEHSPRAGVVFDPFGGSGTTPLTAAMAGWDSYFTEVNPYLSWVADVKVNQARAAVGLAELFRLRELAKVVREARLPRANADHPLLDVDRRRGFFPPGIAERVVGLLTWIEGYLSGPPAELARLACATSLIPVSNMIRRTDLRRRTPYDPPPASFEDTVTAQLDIILEDVCSTGCLIRGRAFQLGDDVRKLAAAERKFELIVTSPPYLNGTNYCRNTKLELLALRFIESEDELTYLRDRAITAGINNVSSRRMPPEPIRCVEVVAEQLDQVAYDRRIPALVRGYFSDMKHALTIIRRNSLPGARFYLDIGDSRFAGINVPTHALLGEIAESVGWQVLSTEVLRERHSYDGTLLVQMLIEMEAA